MKQGRIKSDTKALWNTYVLSIPVFLVLYIVLRNRCDGGICDDFSRPGKQMAEFVYTWGLYAYFGAMAFIGGLMWFESRSQNDRDEEGQ